MKHMNNQHSEALLAGDYQALLSALNKTALLSMTDNKGVITYVNDNFVEISGYTQKELIGQNHRILKSGQQPDKLFDDLWLTISSGQVWRGEIKNRAKNGNYYWVDTSIAPIIGANGRPERYMAVRFLITERQETHQQLERQQQNLVEAKARDEAIIHGIGDGLIATDKQGNIVLTNPAFEELLGWKHSEVLGKSMVDIVPLLDEFGKPTENTHKSVKETLSGLQKKLLTPELTYLKRKNGELFPVSISLSPITRNKEIIGVVEIFRDITHEAEIDRAKSEFVSLASHQLRTPLTAINWYTDMLQAGDAGKLSPEQSKYIAEVQYGSQRMVNLVNSLLNVSRIDLGTYMVEPEPTDLVELCKKIVQDSESKILERKLDFSEQYPEQLGIMNIDPRLARIVIENLISNAIKFTGSGGNISLKIDQKKDNIVISVADTGCGIPKKQHDRIFGKLFRADNAAAHDTEGTGLGLYIAKSVVEASGGKIWFESLEDKGTTFYVEFPEEGMRAHSGTRRLD